MITQSEIRQNESKLCGIVVQQRRRPFDKFHTLLRVEFWSNLKLENLPDVPVTEFFDGQRLALDVNIEGRLLKLKFFKKTWCEEPSD